MQICAKTLLVAALSLSAAADTAWKPLEREVPVHDSATSSWVRGERAPPERPVSLTVAVRVDEDRHAALERVFWEVSDPKHFNYGKHLSLREVTELLAVPQERAERVLAYFVTAGATKASVSPNRDMISVTIPAAAAEAALRTRLHLFSHRERSHVEILRASAGYALPADIARDVTMVGELLQFPRLKLTSLSGLGDGAGSWPNACDSRACSGLVTPAVLAERYKLPEVPAMDSPRGSGSSMAVAEFQGQYFRERDLSAFGRSCHRNVTVDRVVGGDKQEAGVEAELDIEYIKAVAPAVPLTVVYSEEYSLLSWANEVTSMEAAPLVHSVSYGNDEAQQSGAQYMYTCNTAFMKAGVRGLSILFASGDQGPCGREGCGIFRFHFHPDFPAASPYITAVGGTDFAGSDIGEEMAWSAGGGGFSDTFGIPEYQRAAVAAYKSNPDADLPPQKFWNASGRGYPDVSALGGQKAPYCVNSEGFQGVAGTSASCPVVAGVFAMLNAQRLAAGQSPMGFLNPFIYANPSGFQDVSLGKITNGRRYGFKAVKGWDAATGFGTPDFEALSRLATTDAAAAEGVLVV
mmetsp:Transcript_36967/g.101754  ORF Transcript_36967/g.101754 Transcript_36967/m.101754 type:complete len:578 (-) Transcript_36967:397-2130(-)